MPELNPDHPVTKQIHDHWHTLCLMIMRKLGIKEVIITEQDFIGVEPGTLNISIQELADGMHVRVMSNQEMLAFLEEEGKKLEAAGEPGLRDMLKETIAHTDRRTSEAVDPRP